MKRRRDRGLSLLETCAAMSLLALFISVFATLSTRLATAQDQQARRALAMAQLESVFHQLRAQGPATWSVPLKQEVVVDKVRFLIEVEEKPLPDLTDASLGSLVGRVSWDSKTGPQSIVREIWVHERLE